MRNQNLIIDIWFSFDEEKQLMKKKWKKEQSEKKNMDVKQMR
jgi:hypothetical protein